MTNAKVSSEELDAALRTNPATEQGARNDEVTELRSLFAAMRENSAAAAEWHHAAAVREVQRSSSRLSRRRLAWALAFAGVVVSVATPLEMHHHKAEAMLTAQREHDRMLNEQRTDEALLSNIESDLSSSLPRPLEPLSVKETSATTGDTKGNNE